MAIISREGSPKLYMKFMFEGRQIFRSCRTTDVKVAEKREIAERVKLAKEGDKPKALPPAPLFSQFVRLPDPTIERTEEEGEDLGGRFWQFLAGEHAKKPRTLEFYRQRIKSILLFEKIANAKLGSINRELLDAYNSEMNRMKLKSSTMKKNMGTIHRALAKAQDWDLIAAMPKFMKYKKTKRVGVAISFEQEKVYMDAVNQDHRDFCSILVNSGMEPGTAAQLVWSDVHFDAVGKYTHGYIFDRCQKTEVRERELGMTAALAIILKQRWLLKGRPKTGYVFPADRNGKFHHTPLTSFQSAHKRLWKKTTDREPLAVPRFRLYDFRHTALTRAVESGATAFDLKQMAGWASIKMADEYIHLDSESRARSTDRFSDYLESQKLRLVKKAGG